MNTLQITLVEPQDLKTLQTLSKQIFLDSFFEQNNPKDILDYVEHAFSLDQLASELANPDSQFYFVTLEGEPKGYLKVNFGPAQSELHDGKALEIERIYVMAGQQGKKLGQLMLDYAIHIARSRNLEYIWLGVWEYNPKAIRFYERNGFERFSEHSFMLGNDLQMDFLMKRKV